MRSRSQGAASGRGKGADCKKGLYTYTVSCLRVCELVCECVCVCEKMLKKGLMRAKQAEAEDSVGMCVRGRLR